MRMLEYISAPEAAKKWGISERRVQKLCEENRKSYKGQYLIQVDIHNYAARRQKKKSRRTAEVFSHALFDAAAF